MKIESRRRKTEEGKRKTEGGKQPGLLLSAFCLPAAAFYFLPYASVSASPVGRALLVIALLISAYALVRYWRSLEGRTRKVRSTLLSLRAWTLLLMAGALAGLSVEYETKAPALVLLRNLRANRASAEGESAGALRQASGFERAIAALRGRGFEIVEEDADAPARGHGFAAALLLTDGSLSAEEAQREVEQTSVAAGDAPVFVVTDSVASAEPDVALERVTVLGRAVRGVPLAVRCVVHGRGMQGRESLLTVSDDAKVQTSARITWTSNDERQAVTVSVIPKVTGWIDYSAKVEAANDEDAASRTRALTVYAEERRLRVLFFEGEPTWEAKFIRRALEQSGLFEVDYSAQVSRAATIGITEKAREQTDAEAGTTAETPATPKKSGTLNTPEAKLRAALNSTTSLNAYDCVLVGASANTLLSSAESARLRDWVERRGGGLVLLGGNSFNGSIAAPGGKLYPLLPAEVIVPGGSAAEQEISRGRPLEAEKQSAGWTLTPTEAGASGALAGYLNASAETGARTATLTGQGLRLGELRPGAFVLAMANQAGANGVTRESGAALVAAMRYGAGRTLLFAPADSWRIRTSASGDEDSTGGAFNALWQGIVLWTSAGARQPVEIVLSDDAPAVGNLVTAELRVRDAAFAPLKIEKLGARLQPLTEDSGDNSAATAQPREIVFEPDAADSNVWRATFRLHARGRFALELDYAAGGHQGHLEKYFAVAAAAPQGLGASLDTLRRAARESGGELVDAGTNALVERLLATPPGTESVRRTWELRMWWPLAFLLPLLLSAEWFARRWWRED